MIITACNAVACSMYISWHLERPFLLCLLFERMSGDREVARPRLELGTCLSAILDSDNLSTIPYFQRSCWEVDMFRKLLWNFPVNTERQHRPRRVPLQRSKPVKSFKYIVCLILLGLKSDILCFSHKTLIGTETVTENLKNENGRCF